MKTINIPRHKKCIADANDKLSKVSTTLWIERPILQPNAFSMCQAGSRFSYLIQILATDCDSRSAASLHSEKRGKTTDRRHEWHRFQEHGTSILAAPVQELRLQQRLFKVIHPGVINLGPFPGNRDRFRPVVQTWSTSPENSSKERLPDLRARQSQRNSKGN